MSDEPNGKNEATMDPRCWSDERKLAHSLVMEQRLRTRYPLLADAWENSARLIAQRLANRASTDQ